MPKLPLTPFQFGYKIASYSNSAGLGALGGAGLGGLAGLVAPGETRDGKKRGRISGALRGALAGGAVGGLGGLGVEQARKSPAVMAQVNALRAMFEGKPKPSSVPGRADATLDGDLNLGGPRMPAGEGALVPGIENGKRITPDPDMLGGGGQRPSTYSPTLESALLGGPSSGAATLSGDLNLGGPRMITDEDLLGRLPSTYSPTPAAGLPRYYDADDVLGGSIDDLNGATPVPGGRISPSLILPGEAAGGSIENLRGLGPHTSRLS